MAKKAKEQKAKAAKKVTVKGKAGAKVKQPSLTTGEGLPTLKKAYQDADKAKKEKPHLFTAGAPAPSGYAGTTTALAVTPEVLPPASAAEAMLKHPEDEQRLRDIELCIERSLAQSKKLNVASTFTWVVTGIALNAAKDIMRRGCYEQWVNTRFTGFSERQAQYICKLSDVFLRETGGTVQLPAPKEMGSWLVKADQDESCVSGAIKQFVGDMTMVDLLDKYRIKPKKAKGGNRPSNYFTSRYQNENPHLQNKPYEVWPDADKAAFQAWSELEVKDNETAQNIIAAEGAWTSLRDNLSRAGITEKTYAYLTKDQLDDVKDVLVQVTKNINAALTKLGSTAEK